jgi:AmmeMemoRadiSam system protein A
MPSLDPAHVDTLLVVAGRAIEQSLRTGTPWLPDPLGHAAALREKRATFVTLRREGELRGCVGTLEAVRPLVVDVAHNAWAAAFRDPRFPPLEAAECAGLDIHLSLLRPTEPLDFGSEEDLLGQLRPGVDGLILEEDGCRGTFLPGVWESLPEPRAFLRELKRKAGLPADHWSDRIRAHRYTVESLP